jgi:hypothetical protein
MRRLPLLAALFVLSACGDAFGPPPAGGLDLYAHAPPGRIVVDRTGRHLQIDMVQVRLHVQCAETAYGCIPPESAESGWLSLVPGRTVRWAWFRDMAGAPAMIRASFRTGTAGDAPPLGASVLISGVYNPAIQGAVTEQTRFALLVPLEADLRLVMPGGAPGRVRLVLDATSWLFDEEARRLLRIEHLVGRPVDDSTPEGEILRLRIRDTLRLEPF